MKHNDNLIRLLNLNYLTLTNRTVSCGGMDLPAINCNVAVLPDYIALYSQKSLYHKTEHTAVAFFQFDEDFDGKLKVTLCQGQFLKWRVPLQNNVI